MASGAPAQIVSSVAKTVNPGIVHCAFALCNKTVDNKTNTLLFQFLRLKIMFLFI
jgi:hypothetical protein